jgi:hypothetical protein
MSEKLGQKLARRNEAAPTEGAPEGDLELSSNAEVNAKIDTYIKEHPDYLKEYVQKLPRERLERIAVLRKVEKVEQAAERAEQRQRYREASAPKLEKWLEQHPEDAKRISQSVAKLPTERQADARIGMIKSAIVREATGPRL